MEQAKGSLRQQVLERLNALADKEIASASAKACASLKLRPAWRAANTLLFYAPTSRELDVWPLLREALAAGKTVALPRFSSEQSNYIACQVRDPDNDLQTGKFGIREPTPRCKQLSLNGLDFSLVPGVAFDLQGRRLGRGRGYYDQLLAGVRGIRCGVAFDEQIVANVPVEPHDLLVNCILTPSRWIEL